MYMGFFINLIDGWESFKSAKLALANTIEISRVKQIASEKGAKVKVKQNIIIRILQCVIYFYCLIVLFSVSNR